MSTGLSPLHPANLGWVGATVYSGKGSYRWFLGGRTLDPEGLARLVWDRVAVQKLVMVDGEDEAVALLQVYNADLRNGFAYLSFLSTWDLRPIDDAVAEFVKQAFLEFRLRKIYLEVLTSRTGPPLPGSGLPWRQEGRLVKHEADGGEYADLVIYALSSMAEPIE